MRKIFFHIVLIFISSQTLLKAQDTNSIVTRAVIVSGDTLPIVAMSEVKIYGKPMFNNKVDALTFSRLALLVKKVYPYAKLVAAKAQEYNAIIASSGPKKDRKRAMKQAEADLKARFEEEIKNLNDVEGKILIKLIDRETGSSSFDLIKDFRGGVVASMYQSFGRLFGYNLKSTYDPNGEDKYIEQIVVMIENKQL